MVDVRTLRLMSPWGWAVLEHLFHSKRREEWCVDYCRGEGELTALGLVEKGRLTANGQDIAGRYHPCSTRMVN
jgi:hypothetical protein